MPNNNARPFYEIAAKGNKKGEINIFGTIGTDWWGDGRAVEARKFIKDLKALGDVDELIININSPGGSIYEGNAIYNALKAHKATKTVHIQGLAASMGSVIAMAGDKIIMPKNAMMMVHNPATCACGDARDFRKLADVLDRIKEGLVSAYEEKTGKTAEEIAALMDEETWMTAKEAKMLGFADEIGDEVEISNRFDLSKFKNVPADFLAICGLPEDPEADEPEDNEPETPEPSNLTPTQDEGATPVMDFETLKKEQPDVAAKLLEEAAAAERKRIADIEAQAKLCPGHDDLVAQMKADGKTTGPEAAMKLLAAQAAKNEAALKEIENKAATPAPQPAIDNQAEEVVEEGEPVASAADGDLSDLEKFKASLKAKWVKDKALREEFRGNFDRYFHYEKANVEGRVRIKKG